jgi:peroxiredoxin
LICSVGCSTAEKTKKNSTFSISGEIRNPQKGKVILSQVEDVNRKKTRVIGEFSVDSAGKFGQELDLEPHIYELDFYGQNKITLAIDKGQKINIKADGRNLNNIVISGSPDTDKYNAYEDFRNESLNRLVKSVRAEISKLELENNPANKETIEKLGIAEVKNYEKHRDELNEFIEKNMKDSISIYPTTLRWDGEENIEFYQTLAKSFEQKYPKLEITKRINEKVEIIKNTSVGGESAEIKMPDRNGKEIGLSELKGKYILIDFWASWCGPCRRESKKITELYDKYKEQGLEIYGVSLDTEKDLWLKAIEKDNRNWTNVSTLQGFDTPATFEYGVTALPAKFIIDAQGKIVAKNLHGEELKTKIEDLFATK